MVHSSEMRSRPSSKASSRAASQSDSEDDDDISLASTISSEQEDEYAVAAILAQETFPDGERYLVRWEGYPDERATWEPATSFLDNATLRDWEKKYGDIKLGLEEEYDAKDLDDRIEQIEVAKTRRKALRTAKRARLGPLRSSAAAHDRSETVVMGTGNERDGSSGSGQRQRRWEDFGLDVSKTLDKQQRRSGNDSVARKEDGQGTVPDLTPCTSNPTTERAMKATRPRSANKGAISAESRRYAPSQIRSSVKDQPTTQAHSRHLGSKPTLQHTRALDTPSPKCSKLASGFSTGLAKTTARLAKRTSNSRLKSSASGGANQTGKRLRTGHAAASRQSVGKIFRNLSTKRKYEKAGRDEPPPDINALALTRPGDWSAPIIQSATELKQRPETKTDDESPNRVFLDQNGSDTARAERSRPFDQRNQNFRPDLPSLETQNNPESVHEPNYSNTVANFHLPMSNFSGISSRKLSASDVSRTLAVNFDHQLRQGLRDRTPNHLALQPSRGLTRSGRFWEWGEILLSIWFGPAKAEIGDVRIRGFNSSTISRLVELKENHRIDIWFNSLCTKEQYTQLCLGVCLSILVRYC